jgi:hypothetical protein
MKCRHLRAHGWRVLVVTDGEWDALGDSLVARGEFLADRLVEATVCEADRLACSRSQAPVIWSSEAAADFDDGAVGARRDARGVSRGRGRTVRS